MDHWFRFKGGWVGHWFRFNVQRAGWVIGLGLREGWVSHWFRFEGGVGRSLV